MPLSDMTVPLLDLEKNKSLPQLGQSDVPSRAACVPCQ